MGFETEKHTEEISGDCICITMNSEAREKAVVFSGHMDTVHPVGAFGEVPVHQDGEKIYGPGVLDCKGGHHGGVSRYESASRLRFYKETYKAHIAK